MAQANYMSFPDFKLENGLTLKDCTLAYETHGTLNEKKDNAILIFHALSGGSHISGTLSSEEKDDFLAPVEYLKKRNRFREPKEGWWNIAVGPKKAFDTEKFFVICANMLGGCYGSSGPSSINPETGKRYASKFPVITVKDIVRSQKMLIDSLGINKLFAVAGGSFGGFCVLEWAIAYPKSSESFVAIATSATRSNINLSRNNNQKYSITTDDHFNGGEYYENEWPGNWPIKGLKLARMIAHETYVDLDAKEVRDEVVPNDRALDKYVIQNPIESFMHREGNKFVHRFDANSYIKILDAWSMFDVRKNHNLESLEEAFKGVSGEFVVIAISDDYCFYPEESKELFDALERAEVRTHYRIIHSTKGHDAFLAESDKINDAISPIFSRIFARIFGK